MRITLPMIAIALACNPQLLIADEPTTALDVTIQAQVLELMKGLSKEFNTAVMLITHDLGVIAEVSKRVAVMYASKVVEYGDAAMYGLKPFNSGNNGHGVTKKLILNDYIVNVSQPISLYKSVQSK